MVVVSKEESYMITKPGDSSVYIGLTRSEAEDLLAQLTALLDAHPGIVFPAGCSEPDLKIGTKLIDEVGDILIREEGGWRWYIVSGETQHWNSQLDWETVSSEGRLVVIS